jgi:hypothetical protein
MGRYDDLEKLDALRRSGALSEEEFQREKARLLDGSAAPAAAGLTVVDRPWGVETNTFRLSCRSADSLTG